MTNITITGWRYGFNKVQFTLLMKSELGLTLGPAKHLTDRIMNGEAVEIEVPDTQVEHLLAGMRKLGACCEAAVCQH